MPITKQSYLGELNYHDHAKLMDTMLVNELRIGDQTHRRSLPLLRALNRSCEKVWVQDTHFLLQFFHFAPLRDKILLTFGMQIFIFRGHCADSGK